MAETASCQVEIGPQASGNPQAAPWGTTVTATGRGCVFYNFGDAYALRLLVAVCSLREHYEGPVAVFLVRDETGLGLREPLTALGCDVVFEELITKPGDRHRLFRKSPYATTLAFDSDLVFRAPVDELWEPLEREGLLVTRFFAPPYGVDGTPERPGWGNRVGYLESVRALVDTETWEAALHRMLHDRIDVNVGVMGLSRPRGDAFLDDYDDHMERARSVDILLPDEMLTVALLPKHHHILVDEAWNCPADEFFRRTNLADARVIHYFADGQEVHGIRLGRNAATWAGRKWHEAYLAVAQRLDLNRWERADPGFSRSRRDLSAGDSGAFRSELRRLWRFGRRLRTTVREATGSGLKRCYHRTQQIALRVLASLGYRVSIDASGKATVIVLSYKRMVNIKPIVRSALMCRFVERVVVSNNNPDVDLGPWVSLRDPRLVLVQQQRHRGPSYRYDLAREYLSEHYICIDDDVFPSPWQLARMFEGLVRDPSVPRGTAGEVFDAREGRLVMSRHPRAASFQGTRPVDVILQTYLFTRAHLERYFELVRAMGKENEEIHSSEDVILSRAGTGRPVVDNVGFVFQCPSAQTPGVATFRRDGFTEFRHELYHRLLKVR